MAWEIVVGIETHTQLLTKSKIFSGASTAFGAEPNTQASAVDIALPGVLPVLNARAVELAVRFGIAVGANINRRSVFARKNYFYPDLPKGYQISQYEIPVVQGGSLTIVLPDGVKTIRITRAHLEEDAGKSIHGGYGEGGFGQGPYGGHPIPPACSGIDLNRAGTPLLEIVTEPDLRGAKEAVAYARALHALVRWIGICDGNMQEGSFRCDANVSVRRAGDEKLGTRCEIKNLNSFRFMEQAIEYEVRRQIEILEDGGSIEQQTRLYDPDKNETRSMRSKEDAQDYRYFPDPDLLPLVIAEADVERIRGLMPELPAAKSERFVKQFELTQYEAAQLTQSREMAEYFENAVKEHKEVQVLKLASALSDGFEKLVANWITGELAAALNRESLEISESRVSAPQLAWLLARIKDGTINAKGAKEAFQVLWKGESVGVANLTAPSPTLRASGEVDRLIESLGLKQISDSGAIEKVIDEVLAANAKQVEDYRAGREKAFNSLVGQVMKRTQGKANPAQVNEILRRKLKG
jgi:aspartyl-tRNA(Asn)/glutamyl-tRNA(Gln) amidotransferase subunit B